MKPLIVKYYKNYVKIMCNRCGDAQVAKVNSRCNRTGLCSRCLQKDFSSGKIAYWG